MAVATGTALLASALLGTGAAGYAVSQQRKSAKEAKGAMEQAGREQTQLAEQEGTEIKAAGEKAAGEIRAAGQPTEEETTRRARYREKAQTPGETLMTQAGPISQAVARRIQERVSRPIGTYEEGSLMPAVRAQIAKRVAQPGLDYDTQSEAFTQGVSEPLWRALKQRGIAPPPGTEGGGLGTQQYMKGAVPELARLRSEQVNIDLQRGEALAAYEDAIQKGDIEAANAYAQQARNLQNYYEGLENVLSEAMRERLYQSGITAAEAEQRGVTTGGQTIVGGSAPAYASMGRLAEAQLASGQAGEQAAGESGAAMLSEILSAYLMSQGAKTKTAGAASGGAGMQPGGVLSTPPPGYTYQPSSVSLALQRKAAARESSYRA